MNRNQFDFEFGKKHGVNFFKLKDSLFVFRKPLHIWNEITDESIKFKNVDELLKYEIEGVSVWDMIKDRKHLYDKSDFVLSGGRGGGSGNTSTFKMGHGGGGAGKDIEHFPAEANTKIKTKSYDEALKQFSNYTKDKNIEYAYEVDADGFVYGFKEGGSGAVIPTHRKNGSVIIHNHPLPKDSTTSHFSDTDLLSSAMTRSEKGVVATHYRGDHTVAYSFTKGGHFDTAGFTKMIKKASTKGIQGKSYDDAVDKLLKANQKKYGYTYTKTKIKH